MNFIEVTDRFGDIVLINFDRVERIYEVKDNGKNFTKLVLSNGFLYIKETYAQIKELLNVR